MRSPCLAVVTTELIIVIVCIFYFLFLNVVVTSFLFYSNPTAVPIFIVPSETQIRNLGYTNLGLSAISDCCAQKCVRPLVAIFMTLLAVLLRSFKYTGLAMAPW